MRYGVAYGFMPPSVWSARGRWQAGPMHTFCDDYRQDFFWRRPDEGLLIASVAEIVTAPDFTVWNDDPAEWAAYQVWRSAMVAAFWADHGVTVLPVVAFAGAPEQYIAPGTVWAVRGGTGEAWHENMRQFAVRALPALVVVFGREPTESIGAEWVRVPLVSSKGPKHSAAQKEGRAR